MAFDAAQWKTIAAYLSGSLTDQERIDFESWLATSEENRHAFNEARKIWENSGMKLSVATDDTDEGWEELKERFRKEDSGGKVIALLARYPAWRIAASVTLLIGLTYFIFRLGFADTKISAGNEVATVYLPDSTRVWLNVNSTLRYSRDYNDGHREVALDGEGYFIVTSDPEHPFTVSTGEATARVVGTSFNVKETDTTDVILTVAEGHVVFAPKDSTMAEPVSVKANEKAVLRGRNKIVKSRNEDKDFATWRTHNNPVYAREKENPDSYLTHNYTWKKNQINQSVIEGRIKSSATLAAYGKIVLKVSYTKPNGTSSVVRFTVNDTVRPGDTIEYQRRLLDIFTDTKSVKVEIESADTTTEPR
jgi:ferric-dicitrate binding protein FerR (iron transport regulator)